MLFDCLASVALGADALQVAVVIGLTGACVARVLCKAVDMVYMLCRLSSAGVKTNLAKR